MAAHKIITDADRAQVKRLTGLGFTQEQVALVLGVCEKTLRNNYPEELKVGAVVANAQVAQTLFEMATSRECVAATIFWAKTRMRWREKDKEGPTVGEQISQIHRTIVKASENIENPNA